MVDLLPRRIQNLSGGQKQRVGIGRAIVREPRLFIMDEPISHLEAQLRADMRTELKRLHRRLGVTTLYVTHDQLEAVALADRIAVMDLGVLQQVGTPAELFDQPVERVRRRLHRLAADEHAALPQRLARGGGPAARGGRARGPHPGASARGCRRAIAGGAHKLGIRPVDVELGPPEGDVTLRGEVLLRERLGDHDRFLIDCAGEQRGRRGAAAGRRRGRGGRSACSSRRASRPPLRERQRPQAVRAGPGGARGVASGRRQGPARWPMSSPNP